MVQMATTCVVPQAKMKPENISTIQLKLRSRLLRTSTMSASGIE